MVPKDSKKTKNKNLHENGKEDLWPHFAIGKQKPNVNTLLNHSIHAYLLQLVYKLIIIYGTFQNNSERINNSCATTYDLLYFSLYFMGSKFQKNSLRKKSGRVKGNFGIIKF